MLKQNYNCFYANVCHVCKREGEGLLKRCSVCKLVSYCGVQHQKVHWPHHKKVCKSVQQLLAKNHLQSIFQNAGGNTTASEWCNVRMNCVILMEVLLKRKLETGEKQMFMFPRVCAVCRKNSQSCLTDCKDCLCVSYCSQLHQDRHAPEHKLNCLPLSLCRQTDLYIVSNREPYPSFNVSVQLEYSHLPTAIDTFILKYVDASGDMNVMPNIKNSLCSEILSCPLTLLYGLQVSCPKFIDRSIVVHVVGAGLLECKFLSVWETVLHWLPQLFVLHIIFIGPEVQASESDKCHLCANCKNNSKDLILEFQCGMCYHEFLESEYFISPNVIVAYNSGIHENESLKNDTWMKSIPCLLSFKHIPLIITSYTSLEAEKDLARICQHHNAPINILLECQKNPFRSMRPHRDWTTSGIFYQNHFISVLIS